jgi:hypothetical protein
MGEDLNDILVNPYPWQVQLLDVLKNDPDKLNICWIYDPVGNTGKSTFVKYVVYRHKGLILTWDSPTNIFYARTESPQSSQMAYDFTRSRPS